MNPDSKKQYDVIIIGSGISGLNFALRAAEKNLSVIIITKKQIAHSGTNFAQGGIAAVLSQIDNFEKHIKDTLTAGAHHNNIKALKYMVKNGPDAIMRLLNLGVPFATHQGKLLLTREGGHSERRIAFVSDYTGQAIEKILVNAVKKNKFITLYEHTFAADLLVKNKKCFGTQIIRNNKIENIYSDITIIATGGIGQLYAHTTNPTISTGDGIAMAARAGANFRDTEFVQFHPTAFIKNGKTKFLISEAVRGEGAFLRNSKGNRFMSKYHHLAELAPRDVVSRAIFEEEKTGPVYLDLKHKDAKFICARFPKIFQKLKSYGINMAKDLIPISPAAHYLCGGINVNLRGETNIKNLYAFGETARTGVHGANRLASNSLLEALVFSDRILRAGKPRKQTKKIRIYFPVPKFIPLSRAQKPEIQKLRKNLQNLMWKNVGIIRTKSSLSTVINGLAQISAQANKINATTPEIIELKNMTQVSELITKAALKRKKSLGCHCMK